MHIRIVLTHGDKEAAVIEMGHTEGLQQWVAKFFFNWLVVTKGGSPNSNSLSYAFNKCDTVFSFYNKMDFKVSPLDREYSWIHSKNS